MIGDAAFCPTPYGGGLGTTAALVSAYVLAGEISKQVKAAKDSPPKAGALEQALKDYETIVRPFVADAQKVSPLILRILFPRTKLAMMDGVFPHRLGRSAQDREARRLAGARGV